MRRVKDIPGQMSFCFNSENYVVQSNDLVNGHQSLSLQAAKIIRTCIMQIKPDDKEIHPYVIPLGQLCEMLGASKPSLVRDMERICDEIITKPVTIKEYDQKTEDIKCMKIPWVSLCAYSSHGGLAIQLNNQLQPLLVQLSKNYVQYVLQDALTMKSVYAVRLYEMILSRVHDKLLPKEGVFVEISLNEIRTATDTEKRYLQFNDLKKRVIDPAEAEILRCTSYKVTHEYVKTGRKITSINFHVTMQYY